MLDALYLLRAAELFIVAFGTMIVCYAIRTCKRTRSRSTCLLAAGFAITTIGAVTGGVAFEFVGTDLEAAEALYSSLRAVGFLMILISLILTKG